MARTQNTVPTEKLHLSTTPQVLAALDGLVKTGMFGKTRTEVAEELMRLKLRDLVTQGWLDAKPADDAQPRRSRR
jgi:pyruvate/oxaloacetate carboxyltransferase